MDDLPDARLCNSCDYPLKNSSDVTIKHKVHSKRKEVYTSKKAWIEMFEAMKDVEVLVKETYEDLILNDERRN